jgi:uracil phosphoribosyltransferase
VANVYESTHPLVRHKLSALRDRDTPPAEFRRLVRSLAALLVQEATADLATQPRDVNTPLGVCPSQVLADRLLVVPILRAGLGMADGVLDLLPEAEVCHIGLYRDERSLTPVEYYRRLPRNCRNAVGLLLDPMLATGGSAVRACEILQEAGLTRLKVLALIAAPEGVARLTGAFPEIPIHVGVIDSHLTEIGFIYPGLGDAGDRQFGTFHHEEAP